MLEKVFKPFGHNRSNLGPGQVWDVRGLIDYGVGVGDIQRLHDDDMVVIEAVVVAPVAFGDEAQNSSKMPACDGKG